jgi:hypothetical protein
MGSNTILASKLYNLDRVYASNNKVQNLNFGHPNI